MWAENKQNAAEKAIEKSRRTAATPGGLNKAWKTKEIPNPNILYSLIQEGETILITSKLEIIKQEMKYDRWSDKETIPTLEKNAEGVRGSKTEIPIPLEWLDLNDKKSTKRYAENHPLHQALDHLPQAEKYKTLGISIKNGVAQIDMKTPAGAMNLIPSQDNPNKFDVKFDVKINGKKAGTIETITEFVEEAGRDMKIVHGTKKVAKAYKDQMLNKAGPSI